MMDDSAVSSPCVRRCTLNEADVCVGCGRTLNEIKRWSQASVTEQRQIIQAARSRRASFPDSWSD
ncbi:DUF1289 domain-containing protein [Reinekea blandensis]|uniref:DUF1289 domain-containing protein n=1 Tax=Reinekea blandensis MED297 TaxID=314283 RepID=A4BKB9_9GAMM|nr:hypothetical protein MED297_19032 [Reinekea sp. MED297] [Reinekea blandensis MED297]